MDHKNRDIQHRQPADQISALMDGECRNQELNLALNAARNQPDEWEIYHRIGDMLNSTELNIKMSADFTARFNARFSQCAEFVPLHHPTLAHPVSASRFAYALVAMLALVTILIPRFAGNDGAEVDAPYFAAHFMAADHPYQHRSVENAAAMNQTGHARSDTMLRDPSIDSYLVAHQRYSNSMYSAVEYETGPITVETGK